ncbi:hypothetical protein PCE1_001974 [Barthelona sp. PCE]
MQRNRGSTGLATGQQKMRLVEQTEERIRIDKKCTPEEYSKDYRGTKLDEYSFGDKTIIGKGAYGHVYRAKLEEEVLALKVPNTSGYIAHATIRECCILGRELHNGIVKLKGVASKETESPTGPVPTMGLVLQYGTHDLQALVKKKILSEANLKHIFGQIFDVLVFLHDRSILHRDLKPGNVVMTSNGDAKVIDFGLARFLGFTALSGSLNRTDVDLNPRVVTQYYRAPELFYGSTKYNEKVDIWSIGVMLVECLCRTHNQRQPFIHNSLTDILHSIHSLCGRPDEKKWRGVSALPWYKAIVKDFQHCPKDCNIKLRQVMLVFSQQYGYNPSLVDLVCSLLKINPNDRLSARQALKHPWFANSPRAVAPQCIDHLEPETEMVVSRKRSSAYFSETYPVRKEQAVEE